MQKLSLFQPHDQTELGELRKSLPPPMASPPPPRGSEKPRRTKQGRFSDLLEPLDEQAKALKPNCDECRGCNFELRDISSSEIQFQNIHFQHGAGNHNSYYHSRLTHNKLHGYRGHEQLDVLCKQARRGSPLDSQGLLPSIG